METKGNDFILPINDFILRPSDYSQYILTLKHKEGRPSLIQGGIPRHHMEEELLDFLFRHPQLTYQYWDINGLTDTASSLSNIRRR